MFVKPSCGIYPRMSDEPIKLAEGTTAAPRERQGTRSWLRADECGRHAGFGFARPRQEQHWFCFEHKADVERYL
ncbi:hypothetical protein NKI12_29655 [Mesorhizobium australicum]|uniref:Uncharacterized protein n=1 Tax=Mesorhizobium australicum TaxID=536018 RepID=A0ACC6T7W4_9HYPH